jgi:predicted transport protein
MSTVDAAIATQLKNIEKKTGKSLDELVQLVKTSGLAKHGEIRDMLKRDLGLGHGDANTLTHTALKSDGASAAAEKGQTPDDVVDELYAGPKASLRPIHDRLMAEIRKFGDFEVSPKKTYVSLRRKKQFAMIGPATKTQVEVGLNMKDVEPTDRLQQLPPKGMCDYKVRIADAVEVDAEMVGWIRRAYDSAG